MTTAAQQEEEKFLGQMTPVVKAEAPETESPSGERVEISVIDDRPIADQKPRRAGAKSQESSRSDETSDDDIEDYSKGVKKRIAKLRYDFHEERREKENERKIAAEAISYAQRVQQENQYLSTTLATGEAQLVQKFSESAQGAVAAARSAYKDAFDSGDTEKIIEAQEQLINAQADSRQAQGYNHEYTQRMEKQTFARQAGQQAAIQPQQQAQPRQQPLPAPAPPAPKAAAWAEENKWFQSTDHTDMTALAFGVHEDLIKNKGFDPDSDEYFETIDQTMRLRFPEFFSEEDKGSGRQPASTPRQPSTVITPSNRSNGAMPRKVKLTSTQVTLAKRLGLTSEQYARQLMKESK
tara:strand:- start:5416 stop:6471 length:1056 start_codon:yes stop_codon:yes gene_type:complete